MVSFKKVFVTVGTTKFPKLIEAIIKKDVLCTFVSLDYNFIQIQTGKSFSDLSIPPDISSECVVTRNDSITVVYKNKITLKFDPYFEDFGNEISKYDLIISHAGAGTCLDVLKKKKPLLVVINEDLMDNHQIELAEELQNNGYLYYCKCETLNQALKEDFSLLKTYPEPEDVFSNYLNKCMGFVQ